MTENTVASIINSLQQNHLEKEKKLANQYWRDETYKIEYDGEELNLKEIYDRENEYAKAHFENVKKIADQIPEDKFILFVNSAKKGTTHYDGINTIDEDRLKKMVEIETGDGDTHKDDFQAANMRYCLGFAKDDKRFVEFKSYEDIPADFDLTHCAGIVYSGSEINVLDETKADRIKATENVRAIMENAERIGVPELAICFGGQLLSNRKGADIQWVEDENGERKRIIGTPKIKFTQAGKDDPVVGLLEDACVAQNHGQEIDIKTLVEKAGGIVLAVSENGAPEIVRFGDKIYVLQFHPEASLARVDVATSIGREPSDPKVTFKNPIRKIKEVMMTGFMQMVVDNLPEESTQQN